MTPMAVQDDAAPTPPVLSDGTQSFAVAAVAAALLLGFAIVVVREALATLGAVTDTDGDEYQLFAVSLTGLAGGVFAVAMRVGPHRSRRQRVSRSDALRRAIGAAFVVAYTIAGSIAVVICLVRLGSATTLLKSVAATFIGTSVAAASALFGVSDDVHGE